MPYANGNQHLSADVLPIRLLVKGMCYYNAYRKTACSLALAGGLFLSLCLFKRYDKMVGGGEFMEKTGRKRVYDGDATERHKQAMKVYVGKKKQEAEAMGVPLRRVLAGGKRQLNVNIETYLYNKLKDEAKRRNKTLRDLVIEKLNR